MRGFPEDTFGLHQIIGRLPSMPDSIPSDVTSVEGYSTWNYSDALCLLLPSRTEKKHLFNLRGRYSTKCALTVAGSFQNWGKTQANNGLASLVLGWAYVLNASLAERQQLLLQRALQDIPLYSSSTLSMILLVYASTEEIMWWQEIVTRGPG